MIDRLNEYKHKCKVLRQINSDKALLYKRINSILDFMTIFVSAFITFIGFSGNEKILSYILFLFPNCKLSLYNIQLIYNLLVFLLFFIVIFLLVFQFAIKQSESEKALAILSSLINEIDDILQNLSGQVNINMVDTIRYKYVTITQIIPPNTDYEYRKAKKNLESKVKTTMLRQNNLVIATREQQKDYITELVNKSKIVVNVLRILSQEAETLYLGGGVIRNLVWDNLHGFSDTTPIEDIDVIYFNKTLCAKEYDSAIEERLMIKMPNIRWSVKNQARMYLINNDAPYISITDAIEKWPETASAIILRLNQDGTYEFIAPFGFDDLFRLIVVPTPHFMQKLDRYRARIAEKNWIAKWKKLKILYNEEPI